MKIVRSLDATGRPIWAQILNAKEGLLIEGDLFGNYTKTNTRVPINRYLAPVEPKAIIAIAQNYREHALEMGGQLPQRPVFFIKLPNTLQDPGEPIRLPRHLRSDKVDYEAELAIVTGKPLRNASEEAAMDAILGYTAANDVSARDWQKEWGGGQFCRGKGFDTFCPLGPVLVTPEDIPDPGKLWIRGILNGEIVQDGNTADMVFNVPQLLSFLSGSTTLPAGTVILTGTPSGVGAARTPPRFLRAGDTITVEIEKIGSLTNPVLEE
jgi:2-keto-4-pentenoate hydratase/2-oxohepta-3-ene-1,7-dioic acid hydratase in catechol pathway